MKLLTEAFIVFVLAGGSVGFGVSVLVNWWWLLDWVAPVEVWWLVV